MVNVVPIRRVLVGIADAAAAPAQRAIIAAAHLAHVLDAELTGLFIEDALLFDAAAFAAARTLEPRRLEWQAIDRAGLAEAHALAARAAERRLLDEAAALGVPAGFQVVRGDPAATLSRRAEPSDLIVIADPADPIARALPPYPGLARAAWESAAAVLRVPHGVRRTAGPVVVVVRAPTDPALALAASVAGALEAKLIVLAGAADQEAGIARAARDRMGLDCATLNLAALMADTPIQAVRIALAPYRERLLVTSRAAIAQDVAGYLALARARAVPLLLAPAG